MSAEVIDEEAFASVFVRHAVVGVAASPRPEAETAALQTRRGVVGRLDLVGRGLGRPVGPEAPANGGEVVCVVDADAEAIPLPALDELVAFHRARRRSRAEGGHLQAHIALRVSLFADE